MYLVGLSLGSPYFCESRCFEMQHEFPDYYRQFECIGPACKDSCCIGWELDIDEETYEYYRQVEGEFGERLRSSMSDEENTFILGEGDRCPFLNQKNLCDIYIKLGEQSLCNICTEYPRAYESVEQYMQSDLSLSCMEVGRIFFSSNEYIHYETRGDGKRTQKIKDKKLRKILEIRQLFLNILQSNDLDRQG